MRERATRWPGAGIAINRRGPAAPVADQLELDGLELVAGGRPDYAAACQDLYDRITERDGDGEPAPTIRFRRHEALDDAADVAGKQGLGDGGWVLSRTKSTGDISTLEAGALAAWAVAREPVDLPAPFVMFG
jgi:hypothetical protein